MHRMETMSNEIQMTQESTEYFMRNVYKKLVDKEKDGEEDNVPLM